MPSYRLQRPFSSRTIFTGKKLRKYTVTASAARATCRARSRVCRSPFPSINPLRTSAQQASDGPAPSVSRDVTAMLSPVIKPKAFARSPSREVDPGVSVGQIEMEADSPLAGSPGVCISRNSTESQSPDAVTFNVCSTQYPQCWGHRPSMKQGSCTTLADFPMRSRHNRRPEGFMSLIDRLLQSRKIVTKVLSSWCRSSC